MGENESINAGRKYRVPKKLAKIGATEEDIKEVALRRFLLLERGPALY